MSKDIKPALFGVVGVLVIVFHALADGLKPTVPAIRVVFMYTRATFVQFWKSGFVSILIYLTASPPGSPKL
jgi:hypothetical protein